MNTETAENESLVSGTSSSRARQIDEVIGEEPEEV
jgi:hypothetical protein